MREVVANLAHLFRALRCNPDRVRGPSTATRPAGPGPVELGLDVGSEPVPKNPVQVFSRRVPWHFFIAD